MLRLLSWLLLLLFLVLLPDLLLRGCGWRDKCWRRWWGSSRGGGGSCRRLLQLLQQ